MKITRRKYVTDSSGGSPSRSTVRMETKTSGSGSVGGNVSSSTEKSLQDFFSSDSPKGESTGLEFDDDDDDEPEVTTKRVVVKSASRAKK